MSTAARTEEEEAAAWEREMEMAIEGRGRTRSRSILATHTSEDDDTPEPDFTVRRSSSRRGGGELELPDSLSDTRSKSGSIERPADVVDVEDAGHDPNYLHSPAGGADRNVRSRARSFTAQRTMEMEEARANGDAADSASSRRRSRSFSSHNRNRDEDDEDEPSATSEEEMEQIVRRATSLSKIYLVGSAPVDVSKLQDESKIVGVKKVELVEPTGALSTRAMDALTEGLQSFSVDGVTASTQDESSLLTEAELEEKRMAEEEDKKLRNQKLSSRKKLSEKASFFKAKMFKNTGKSAGGGAAAPSPPLPGNGGKPSSGGGSSTAAAAAATSGASFSGDAGRPSKGEEASADAAAASSLPSPAPVVIKRHKLKLLLLGDSGVGKTSLMRVFSGDEFSESMLATAGVDFKLRNIAVGDDEIALQIWDTAGQERFHRITATYYKGANGIVLVYDVSDKKSFDNVGYWMNNIRQYASPNMPAMLLVGNKIDLPNRVVPTEEGLATAKQYNVRFIETSAKTSENTNGALETIARDAFFMSVNSTMTQKMLMEREKSLLGRRNKENCVIS